LHRRMEVRAPELAAVVLRGHVGLHRDSRLLVSYPP
jgi:hypothetical protein